MPVLFVLVLGAMTVRLLTMVSEPGVAAGGYVDFRDAVYAPANALLDGVDPYDVDAFLAHSRDAGNSFDPYLPHHLLLAIPLAIMPYAAAGTVWWMLNVALLLTLSGFAVKRCVRSGQSLVCSGSPH